MSLEELSSTTSCVVSDCCSMREHNCTYFCCISASCSCIERSCDLRLARIEDTIFSTRARFMLSASGSARLDTMPLPGVGVRSSRSLSSKQQSSRSIISCFAMRPPVLPAPVDDAGDGTVSSTSSGSDATSSSITSLFSCLGLIVSTTPALAPFASRPHTSADVPSKSSHFVLSLAPWVAFAF
uniref:Uncharacterized protein n=1 Tax=Anopheles culicifacies TaxID=139723 RepID=A0A182MSX7_9DIPT